MADLTTLANVRMHLGLKEPETDPDAFLQVLIPAVSAWFRGQVDRQIGAEDVSEKYAHEGGDLISVRESPVTAVASFAVDGVPVPRAATDSAPGWYILAGRLYVRGWYVPAGSIVSITYTAGYTPVPADVDQAVREMVALKYRERGSVGTQTVSALGQSITFLPSITPRAVQDVIDRYRRMSV